jgi:hypothetical protein
VRSFICVVIAALTVLGVAAGSAWANHDPGNNPMATFGFNDDWGFPSNGNSREIADMGAILPDDRTVNRLHISWAVVEPKAPGLLTQLQCLALDPSGTYVGGHCFQWDDVDQAYAALQAQSDRPVIQVGNSPAWARDAQHSTCLIADEGKSCNSFPPDPDHLPQWRFMLEQVIARYGVNSSGQVAKALEVWNEPNLTKFWGPGVNPAEYTPLLYRAYVARSNVAASKPAAGDLPIITAGLSGQADTVPHDEGIKVMRDAQFLQGVYDNAQRAWFDGIGIHPYDGGRPTVDGMWTILNRIIDKRNANGDDGNSAPLYITEMGASSNSPNPTDGTPPGYGVKQGDCLLKLYRSLNGHAIKTFIVHRFREDPMSDGQGVGDSWFDWSAVTHRDFSPKESYNVIGDFFQQPFVPSCPDA